MKKQVPIERIDDGREFLLKVNQMGKWIQLVGSALFDFFYSRHNIEQN